MKKTVDIRPSWPLFRPHCSAMTLMTGERMLRSAYMKTQPSENSRVTATGPGRLLLTGSRRRAFDGLVGRAVVAAISAAAGGVGSVTTLMEGLLEGGGGLVHWSNQCPS